MNTQHMPWTKRVSFFQEVIDGLSEKPFRLAFNSYVGLLGCPGSDAADKAILYFANNSVWPKIADEVRLEICMRLLCARLYCAGMVEGGDEAEDESHVGFLESLLIEYWKDVGRKDWLHSSFVMINDENK